MQVKKMNYREEAIQVIKMALPFLFLQKEQRFSPRDLLRCLKLHNKDTFIFLQVLGV